MARYGYTVLLSSTIKYALDGERLVVKVNNKTVGKRDKRSLMWVGGEPLHDYLTRAGQAGWRVVSSNSVGEGPTVLIILEKCMAD